MNHTIAFSVGILLLAILATGCNCLQLYPKYDNQFSELGVYPKLASYDLSIYPKLPDYSGIGIFPAYTWLDENSTFEVFPKLIECPAQP